MGLLTPVVTGPQYHRIHHSIEPKHLGKNYAAFFPIWDRIFGTCWQPARDEWPETGLPDTNGVWAMQDVVFAPFLGWWRRIAGRLK
jgi:sterol desaturase/sphingolipid hydroxylase (fatty acid hydroxylase superfamily)